MSEQNLPNSTPEIVEPARFVFDDNTPESTRQQLEELQDGATKNPEAYGAAVSFYAKYPEAAVAVLSLTKEKTGLAALKVVTNVFDSSADLEVDFDEGTEQRLDEDQLMLRYRAQMKSSNKETARGGKSRMRIQRIRTAFGLPVAISEGGNPPSDAAA